MKTRRSIKTFSYPTKLRDLFCLLNAEIQLQFNMVIFHFGKISKLPVKVLNK